MNVLVADDDPVSRRLLGGLLASAGYEPSFAEDGERALEAVSAEDAPRLCVLDRMMPGLDGLEVCRRVKAGPRGAGTYLIILTVRGAKSEIVEGLAAGANDYLTKPFDGGEMLARVGVGARFVELHAELERKIAELTEASSHIKRLQGIIPICMHCHKIRTDKASWEKVEKYISEHSEARFSHGICPDCERKYYKL